MTAPRALLAGALGVALLATAVAVPADPAADRVHHAIELRLVQAGEREIRRRVAACA